MTQLSLLDQARLNDPGATDPEHITEIADRTISELDEKPPISLEVVAAFRDIREILVEPLPMAASLTPEPRGLVMRLRASDSRRRRRFSGFHEVGHTFQPGYYDKQQQRCSNPSPVRRDSSDPEALSDVAASELILPRKHFLEDVAGATFGLADVVGLADLYQASVQATSYRFADFWPEPCLVVMLEPGLRKEERNDPNAAKKLRVVSAWPASGKWPYVPTNKSARENGALDRSLAGEHIDEPASLAELALADPGHVRLSARAFTYWNGRRMVDRVVALYRQAKSR